MTMLFESTIDTSTIDTSTIDSSLTIDVRSPSEFHKGHIPGAINIPLFSDHERALVGTAYTQVSPQAAMDLGLDLVGPKLRTYIEALREQLHQRLEKQTTAALSQTIVLYCWRGGKRSSSMAWLFRTAGYTVHVIEGGYRAYRRHVLQALEYPWKFAVIGGRTGSGKTQVLHILHNAGEQVLDLEAIAHHKGSSFGALNQLPQPTTEQAMNNMHLVLSGFDRGRAVFVEDESLRVGTVALHPPLYERIRHSPLLNLEVPRDVRSAYLADDYGLATNDQLNECFIRIGKRLGGVRLRNALLAIERGDRASAANEALDYYDRTYDYGLRQRNADHQTVLSSPHELSTDEVLSRCRMWVQDLAKGFGGNPSWHDNIDN